MVKCIRTNNEEEKRDYLKNDVGGIMCWHARLPLTTPLARSLAACALGTLMIVVSPSLAVRGLVMSYRLMASDLDLRRPLRRVMYLKYVLTTSECVVYEILHTLWLPQSE
ncbi:hypothetical protein ACFE04_010161 [Oxalis oulophora]